MRTTEQDQNNPYSLEERRSMISKELAKEGYSLWWDYEIMPVPNITHITYGRDVGYTIEKENLEEDIENISATKIRNER